MHVGLGVKSRIVVGLGHGLALLLGGCDVSIYGALELEGEPVRVVPGEGQIKSVAVGLLDEHVMVEWVRPGPNEYTGIPTARWLDSNLEPVGAPLALGVGYGFASRWLRDGDALVGQVWATPTFRTDVRDDRWIHLWHLRAPPGEATYQHVEVEATVTPDPLWSIVWLGAPRLGVGAEGALPLAATGSGLVGAFGVLPRECDSIALRRLETFTTDQLTGRALPLPVDSAFCDLYAGQPGAPWLLELDDGVGLFYRQGPIGLGEQVHFARLDAMGRLATDPVVVGGPRARSGVDGGNQPRAVRIGHRILFTERRGSENDCHFLRVMNDDGTGAGDAPWQLPCAAFADNAFVSERRITPSVELVAVPGGAVLVWSEHNFVSGWITRDAPWDEGIYAVLLDAGGRRGSEVVQVTDDAATALSPIPRTDIVGPVARPFVVAAAGEGDRIVVAWYDNRAGAEGIYARTLRFRRN